MHFSKLFVLVFFILLNANPAVSQFNYNNRNGFAGVEVCVGVSDKYTLDPVYGSTVTFTSGQFGPRTPREVVEVSSSTLTSFKAENASKTASGEDYQVVCRSFARGFASGLITINVVAPENYKLEQNTFQVIPKSNSEFVFVPAVKQDLTLSGNVKDIVGNKAVNVGKISYEIFNNFRSATADDESTFDKFSGTVDIENGSYTISDIPASSLVIARVSDLPNFLNITDSQVRYFLARDKTADFEGLFARNFSHQNTAFDVDISEYLPNASQFGAQLILEREPGIFQIAGEVQLDGHANRRGIVLIVDVRGPKPKVLNRFLFGKLDGYYRDRPDQDGFMVLHSMTKDKVFGAVEFFSAAKIYDNIPYVWTLDFDTNTVSARGALHESATTSPINEYVHTLFWGAWGALAIAELDDGNILLAPFDYPTMLWHNTGGFHETDAVAGPRELVDIGSPTDVYTRLTGVARDASFTSRIYSINHGKTWAGVGTSSPSVENSTDIVATYFQEGRAPVAITNTQSVATEISSSGRHIAGYARVDQEKTGPFVHGHIAHWENGEETIVPISQTDGIKFTDVQVNDSGFIVADSRYQVPGQFFSSRYDHPLAWFGDSPQYVWKKAWKKPLSTQEYLKLWDIDVEGEPVFIRKNEFVDNNDLIVDHTTTKRGDNANVFLLKSGRIVILP